MKSESRRYSRAAARSIAARSSGETRTPSVIVRLSRIASTDLTMLSIVSAYRLFVK